MKYPIFWRFSCQCPWIYYLRPSSAKTAKKAEGWFQLTAADFFHSRSLPNRYYCDEMIPSIDLGAEYLVFISSRSLKTREKYTNWDNLVCFSLYIFWAQSHLCLLLQKKVFCKSKHRWLCPQKIYKLKQTKLSQFVYFSLVLREREKTKTKYSAP